MGPRPDPGFPGRAGPAHHVCNREMFFCACVSPGRKKGFEVAKNTFVTFETFSLLDCFYLRLGFFFLF